MTPMQAKTHNYGVGKRLLSTAVTLVTGCGRVRSLQRGPWGGNSNCPPSMHPTNVTPTTYPGALKETNYGRQPTAQTLAHEIPDPAEEATKSHTKWQRPRKRTRKGVTENTENRNSAFHSPPQPEPLRKFATSALLGIARAQPCASKPVLNACR